MKFLAIALATAAFVGQASAWEVESMNDTIDSANFIVDRGCSGTLISLEHRLILTNFHCIGNAIVVRNKEVVGSDGVVSKVRVEELRPIKVSQKGYNKHSHVSEKTYIVDVVARWKQSDLALLQVKDESMPNTIAAAIFAGDEVLRGSEVFAVGNPLGLDATVTRGIVSSTTRTFRVSWADAEVPFIQIDAGIAGGNSGGSMYNTHGELIGVPAAGARNQGHLGLAIPFDRVQEFLTENCYGEVWDVEAASYEDCVAEKEAEDEEVSSTASTGTTSAGDATAHHSNEFGLVIDQLR